MDQTEKKTNTFNPIGVTRPNGQIGRNDNEILEKGTDKRKSSNASTHGEAQIPRRLSQLFYPPNEEKFDKDTTNETSRLLVDAEKGTIVPPQQVQLTQQKAVKEIDPKREKPKFEDADGDGDSLSILEHIEDAKIESDFESDNASDHSLPSRDSGDESEENLLEKEADCTWDDTICSNRSAYFKHYYQKNLSSLGGGRSEGGTSHNSLVSLIREKNKMGQEKSSDENKKKKKREDLSLMILVIFLFLVLVIGISLIYHFYNLHLEELSLFKRLKFHEEGRLLDLIDSEGNLDIEARLGATLPPFSKPEDCTHYLQYYYKYRKRSGKDISTRHLISTNKTAVDFIIKRQRRQNEFQFDDETVCLDWANQARVQIHRAPSQAHVNCYNVFWSAQGSRSSLQDCMQIRSPERGVWWGIGEMKGGGYPLESIKNMASAPLQTGDLAKYPFGRILRRTFLSSSGGLLVIPDHLPASVSVTSDELCISVNSSGVPNFSVPLTLNYTICSSPNVSSTIEYLRYLALGSKYFVPMSKKNKELIRERILERIEYPVWIPYKHPGHTKITQDSVLRYVEEIMRGNQSQWGHVLLPLSWQKRSGDLTFDAARFPEPKAFVETLLRKGFRVALTVSPLVATDTKSFKNGTTEGFWVQQRGSSLPALIQYDDVMAGALTDFTNPRAAKWFASKLTAIKDEFNIDRFHLNPPDSHSIPIYHEFNQDISNADLALQPFLRATAAVSPPMSTESIISPPPLPTFVVLGNEDSSWKSLASLVPRILTLSMLGFPLVDAGVVGGTPTREGNVPDQKLYIRWFQAVSFLPAFQMNVLPEMFDEDTQAIVRDCLQKRKQLVLPRLQKAVSSTLVNNTPLISPLGLLFPDDVEAAGIGDEWIIGGDLLVAPILEEGETSRNIYFPSGLWESHLDGRMKPGPGWIYDYKVPLSDVAHFLRRPIM